VPQDSIFAGHSLGEYAALASYATVLSVPDLVETVFLRGMVMQNAVERDDAGRSRFAMVAANPSRVGPKFNAEALFKLVDTLGDMCGELLQVVNFNVRDSQYVVAGHLMALDALESVLSALAQVSLLGFLRQELILEQGTVAASMSLEDVCQRVSAKQWILC